MSTVESKQNFIVKQYKIGLDPTDILKKGKNKNINQSKGPLTAPRRLLRPKTDRDEGVLAPPEHLNQIA